jgi:PAS domain S-box-containing protein
MSEGMGLGGLGLKPGELVGRSAFEVYGANPHVAGNLRRALSGETFSSVVGVSGPDFPAPKPVFECSYNPLRGSGGAVVGVVGFAVDITRRGRAEDALTESYRELVEAVGDGIALIGPEGGVVRYCNEAYAEIFGLSREALVGRSFFEFVAGEQEKEARRQKEMRLRGEGSSYEITITAFGGEEKVLACGGYPITGPDGSFEGAVQTARDVTGEWRAREELRRSEERLGLVTRATGEVIWDIDLESDEQSWDGAVEEVFGYPKRQVTNGAWWEERVHPEDRERVLGKVEAVLVAGGGETWRDEYRFLKADGSYATVADRAYVVRDSATGEPVRMLGAMADVTGRKRMEEALREAAERFRTTFDRAAVGMAHVSPDGRWLRINPKLCQILGYTREELLSLSFQDITHPDDLDADLEQVRRVLEGRMDEYSMEKRYFHKNLSRIWVNLTVSLVRHGDSWAPMHFVSVVEDITARKLGELLSGPVTDREMRVLELVARGWTNLEIAREIGYSKGTVKDDVQSVLRKLGAEDRRQAADRAVEIGLIPPQRR